MRPSLCPYRTSADLEAGMVSSRTVLDLEDKSRTKSRSLGFGLEESICILLSIVFTVAVRVTGTVQGSRFTCLTLRSLVAWRQVIRWRSLACYGLRRLLALALVLDIFYSNTSLPWSGLYCLGDRRKKSPIDWLIDWQNGVSACKYGLGFYDILEDLCNLLYVMCSVGGLVVFFSFFSSLCACLLFYFLCIQCTICYK